MTKPKKNQLGILGILSREFIHYVGNSAEGLRSRRERCWGHVSIFENFCLIYVFNLFFLNICLIFWYDNLQVYNVVAINKRDLPPEYTQKVVTQEVATSLP